MFANLSGAHLLVILAVVLLFFGAPKLPALARSLGQSLRIFQREVSDTERASVSDAAHADEETQETAQVANPEDRQKI